MAAWAGLLRAGAALYAQMASEASKTVGGVLRLHVRVCVDVKRGCVV